MTKPQKFREKRFLIYGTIFIVLVLSFVYFVTELGFDLKYKPTYEFVYMIGPSGFTPYVLLEGRIVKNIVDPITAERNVHIYIYDTSSHERREITQDEAFKLEITDNKSPDGFYFKSYFANRGSIRYYLQYESDSLLTKSVLYNDHVFASKRIQWLGWVVGYD